MSDDEDDDDNKPRRRPLSRSRKLGSRRRRGRRGEGDDEGDEDDGESGAEEAGGDDGPADEAFTAPNPVEDHTLAVNARIPSPGGVSGTPVLDDGSAPAGEKWAKVQGAARRFGLDFSNYLVGLGQTAHQSGVDFGQNVVKPFSHALFEAAICLALLVVCGVFGAMFGGYLKTVTSEGGKTVSFQNREVRPGQQIDESLLSQGFEMSDIHQGASRILDQHLGKLRRSQFVEAYTLLSPAWKEQLSFPTFQEGYTATRIVDYDIGKVESLSNQRIRLRAELKVQERGRERIYSAVYIAILTPDGWRLDGGTFR